MRFVFKEVPSWPPLAWLAQVQPGEDAIIVWHGARVECGEEGFCEAVWVGDFKAMAFDRTDLVFGSGCRLRGERAVFVTSGSTLDRLHLYRNSDRVDVSNSLVCISEVNEITFPPDYPHYQADFRSIQYGLEKYATEVQTDGTPVELVYYRNLIWDGESFTFEDKPFADRAFEGFSNYESFLTDGLAALADNMRSADRRGAYEPLGTLSSGYDSSTVAVLIRDIGCRQVICFRMGRGGRDDDGSATADRLGLEVIAADRDAWRQRRLPEVPFMASNAFGEEVQYAAVLEHLEGKVLFTGMHGDVMWGKDLLAGGRDLVRPDWVGLSLTEVRLWHGFIHCPLPFWGARNPESIHAITNSEEMKAWDVPGDYSRPICRRIVETAGVPRGSFAISKRATSTIFKWEKQFLSPSATRSYRAWLGQQRSIWLRRRAVPPQWRPALRNVLKVVNVTSRLLRRVRMRRADAYLATLNRRWDFMKAPPTYPFVFPWAMHEARKRYRAEPSAPWDERPDSVS